MNIKQRNFIVTALGSLMVMGTLFSPLSASATSASTPAVEVINIADGIINITDDFNFELNDAITIEPMSFEEMMKSFDIKPSDEDKKQMKTYFDQAEKLDKAGKYDEAIRIWEKFDKILGKYVDFSNIEEIKDIETETYETNITENADSKIYSVDFSNNNSDVKVISGENINTIMNIIKDSMK